MSMEDQNLAMGQMLESDDDIAEVIKFDRRPNPLQYFPIPDVENRGEQRRRRSRRG